MGTPFWIRRFLVVFVGAFLVICAAQFLRHRNLSYAVEEGLVCAGITAAIFTAARIYQSSQGQHCAICKDSPEMQRGNSTNSE